MLFAANRDELLERAWLPPARHWPDRPNVVAGLDRLAGGSWFGLNDEGVVAAVMNRRGSLGPVSGRRSRGELVLEALDHAEAATAADALADLDPAAYRSFNLVVADGRKAYWLCHRGANGSENVEVTQLSPGVSMLTARDCNDMSSPRVRAYLPRFQTASTPDPANGDWAAWEMLLASRGFEIADGPEGAMTVVTDHGFGTVSSSILALPAPGRVGERPRWRFAAGRPDRIPYEDVAL
jgi:uncharacterized protein with NRDE domain